MNFKKVIIFLFLFLNFQAFANNSLQEAKRKLEFLKKEHAKLVAESQRLDIELEKKERLSLLYQKLENPDLIIKSGFKHQIFKDIYGFASNYSNRINNLTPDSEAFKDLRKSYIWGKNIFLKWLYLQPNNDEITKNRDQIKDYLGFLATVNNTDGRNKALESLRNVLDPAYK